MANPSMRRFTPGLRVEHFDWRVDLHRVIETLAERSDVIVFTGKPFVQRIRGLNEV